MRAGMDRWCPGCIRSQQRNCPGRTRRLSVRCCPRLEWTVGVDGTFTRIREGRNVRKVPSSMSNWMASCPIDGIGCLSAICGSAVTRRFPGGSTFVAGFADGSTPIRGAHRVRGVADIQALVVRSTGRQHHAHAPNDAGVNSVLNRAFDPHRECSSPPGRRGITGRRFFLPTDNHVEVELSDTE